ncbi:hypothetical protein GCM10010449_64480 [Streptomyces rectiviolaceus]|uniref:Uncharacterized protein n=1 Tax=Streptomyces rectiviolaceus TaxID=332591 RepID=A0ABP6N334_9ACTN
MVSASEKPSVAACSASAESAREALRRAAKVTMIANLTAPPICWTDPAVAGQPGFGRRAVRRVAWQAWRRVRWRPVVRS